MKTPKPQRRKQKSWDKADRKYSAKSLKSASPEKKAAIVKGDQEIRTKNRQRKQAFMLRHPKYR